MEDCVRTSRGTVLRSEAARRNQRLLDLFKIGNDKCVQRTESYGIHSRLRPSKVSNAKKKIARPTSLYDFRTQYDVDSRGTSNTVEFYEQVPGYKSDRRDFLGQQSRILFPEPISCHNEAKETNIGLTNENLPTGIDLRTKSESPSSKCPGFCSKLGDANHFELTKVTNSRSETRNQESSSLGNGKTVPLIVEELIENENNQPLLEAYGKYERIVIPDLTQNHGSFNAIVNSRTEQSELEPKTAKQNFDRFSTEQIKHKDSEPETISELDISKSCSQENWPLIGKLDSACSYIELRGRHTAEYKKQGIENIKAASAEYEQPISIASTLNKLKVEIRKESEADLGNCISNFINDLLIELIKMHADQSLGISQTSEAKGRENEGNCKPIVCHDEEKSRKKGTFSRSDSLNSESVTVDVKYFKNFSTRSIKERCWGKKLGLLIVLFCDSRSEMANDKIAKNHRLCNMEQYLNDGACEAGGYKEIKNTVKKKNCEEETFTFQKSGNAMNSLHSPSCNSNEIESITQQYNDNIEFCTKEGPDGKSDLIFIKDNGIGAKKTAAEESAIYPENFPMDATMNRNTRGIFYTISKNFSLNSQFDSKFKALLLRDPAHVDANIGMKRIFIGSEPDATDITKSMLNELENSEECIDLRGLDISRLRTSRKLEDISLETARILKSGKDSEIGVVIMKIGENKKPKPDENGKQEEINCILKDIDNTVPHIIDDKVDAKMQKSPEETEIAGDLVLDLKGTVGRKPSSSVACMESQASMESNISQIEVVDQLPCVQQKSSKGTVSSGNVIQNEVAENEFSLVISNQKFCTDANGVTEDAPGVLDLSMSSQQDNALNEKEVMTLQDTKISLEERPSSVESQNYHYTNGRESNRGLFFIKSKCDSEELVEKNSLGQSEKVTSENENINFTDIEQCRDIVPTCTTTRTEEPVMERALRIANTEKGSQKLDIANSFDARFARLCWKIQRYSLDSLKSKVEERKSPFSFCTSLDPDIFAGKYREQRSHKKKENKYSKPLLSSKASDAPVILNIVSAKGTNFESITTADMDAAARLDEKGSMQEEIAIIGKSKRNVNDPLKGSERKFEETGQMKNSEGLDSSQESQAFDEENENSRRTYNRTMQLETLRNNEKTTREESNKVVQESKAEIEKEIEIEEMENIRMSKRERRRRKRDSKSEREEFTIDKSVLFIEENPDLSIGKKFNSDAVEYMTRRNGSRMREFNVHVENVNALENQNKNKESQNFQEENSKYEYADSFPRRYRRKRSQFLEPCDTRVKDVDYEEDNTIDISQEHSGVCSQNMKKYDITLSRRSRARKESSELQTNICYEENKDLKNGCIIAEKETEECNRTRDFMSYRLSNCDKDEHDKDTSQGLYAKTNQSIMDRPTLINKVETEGYRKKYRIPRNSYASPKDEEEIHVEEKVHVEENLSFKDDRYVGCKDNPKHDNEKTDESLNGSIQRYFEAKPEGNLEEEKGESLSTDIDRDKNTIIGWNTTSNKDYSTYGGDGKIEIVEANLKNEITKEDRRNKMPRGENAEENYAKSTEGYRQRLEKSKYFEILSIDGQGKENSAGAEALAENENMANTTFSAYNIEDAVVECERKERKSKATSDEEYGTSEICSNLIYEIEEKSSEATKVDSSESDEVFPEGAHRAEERRIAYKISRKSANNNRRETFYDGETLQRRRIRRSNYCYRNDVEEERQDRKTTSYYDRNEEIKCIEQERDEGEGSASTYRGLLNRSRCIDIVPGNKKKERNEEPICAGSRKNSDNVECTFNRKESSEGCRKRFRRSKCLEINVKDGKRCELEHVKNEEPTEDGSRQLNGFGKSNEHRHRREREAEVSKTDNEDALDCKLELNCGVESSESKRRRLRRLQNFEGNVEEEQEVDMQFGLSKRGKIDGQCTSEERYGSRTEERYRRYRLSRNIQQSFENDTRNGMNEDSVVNCGRDIKGNEPESCVEKKEHCVPFRNNRRLARDRKHFENEIRDESEDTGTGNNDKAFRGKELEARRSKNEEACHSKVFPRLGYFETCTENTQIVKIEKEQNARDDGVVTKPIELDAGNEMGKVSSRGHRISKYLKTSTEYDVDRVGVDISNETYSQGDVSKDTVSRNAKDMEGVCFRERRRSRCFEAGAKDGQEANGKDIFSSEENQLIKGIESVPFSSTGIERGSLMPNRKSYNFEKTDKVGKEKQEAEGLTTELKEVIEKTDCKRFLCKIENNSDEGLYGSNYSEKTESIESTKCGADETPLIYVDRCQEDNSIFTEKARRSLNSKEKSIIQETKDRLSKNEILQSDCSTPESSSLIILEQGTKKYTSPNTSFIEKTDCWHGDPKDIEKGLITGRKDTFIKSVEDFSHEIRDKSIARTAAIDDFSPESQVTDTSHNAMEDDQNYKQRHEQRMLVGAKTVDNNIATLRADATIVETNELIDKEIERPPEEESYHGYYINNVEDPINEIIRRGGSVKLEGYKTKNNYEAVDSNRLLKDRPVDFISYESKMRRIKQEMQQLVDRNIEMEERIECGAREADVCEDKQWQYFLKKQKLVQLAVRKLWQKEGFDSSRLIQDKENNVYMTGYDLHRKR